VHFQREVQQPHRRSATLDGRRRRRELYENGRKSLSECRFEANESERRLFGGSDGFETLLEMPDVKGDFERGPQPLGSSILTW
jgi:hypothetical protein